MGLKPITSLSDTDEKSVTCNALYPVTRDGILAMHPWRFAMKKYSMTKDGTDPINEWAARFAFPANVIEGPHALFTSADPGAEPITAFEVFEKFVQTEDHAALWGDFIYDPGASEYPALFVLLLEFATASAIGAVLTDNEKLVQFYHEAAFGTPSENLMGGLMGKATQVQTMNNSNNALQLDDDSIVTARFS